MINIQALIDDAKCFATVRELRWPVGVKCPACGSTDIGKRGFHATQPTRQRYQCQACGGQFDDLTEWGYLGFFEFVHNVRRRGKALLGALLAVLLAP